MKQKVNFWKCIKTRIKTMIFLQMNQSWGVLDGESLDGASAGVITPERLAEALTAISIDKTQAFADKTDVNLDIMTEEEQIAYAIRMSIQQED